VHACAEESRVVEGIVGAVGLAASVVIIIVSWGR